MSIVNHFRNKLVSGQRNIHNIQILCTVPPKMGFFRGDFCLSVDNVLRMVDRFFTILSHGVGRLFTYKVSVVISGQTGFALKIALKS